MKQTFEKKMACGQKRRASHTAMRWSTAPGSVKRNSLPGHEKTTPTGGGDLGDRTVQSRKKRERRLPPGNEGEVVLREEREEGDGMWEEGRDKPPKKGWGGSKSKVLETEPAERLM